MRIAAALRTIPDGRTWGRCALAYLVFLVVAFPIGLMTGLLHPGIAQMPSAQILTTALVVLVHPAFVEEFVFRVVLLPRETARVSRGRLAALVVLSLALYVGSHPVNAILFRPQVIALFESPAYLTVTTLLGVTCTAAYFISRSIWPSVVIHWLTVVLWVFTLGGQALLSGTIPRT